MTTKLNFVIGLVYVLTWCQPSYCFLFVVPRSPTSFLANVHNDNPSLGRIHSLSALVKRQRRASSLRMTNFDSNDPFQILGLDEATTDKKVIKRAYKRMALKYHPDVVTTKDSTPEEKKKASDRFAKINWAYGVLTGKQQDDATYKTSTGTRSTGTASGWTPPHRRSEPSYSSSRRSSGDSFDWNDFMPKDYDAAYDAGGDSFGKIFSDLLAGAAAGAAGLGGGPNIFKDFVEFLEGNIDGFGGAQDDAELRILLNTGSVDEIGNEMSDTELVVQQLKSKQRSIEDEILTLTAESKMIARYLEKMEIDEKLAGLKARNNVVKDYIKKAQNRLLSLQTRYKQLITQGETLGASRRNSSSSWDDIRNEATSTSRTSSAYSSSASSASGARKEESIGDKDKWMNEGFGSSGRGRSSRSRSRSNQSPPNTDESAYSRGSSFRRETASTSTSAGPSTSEQSTKDYGSTRFATDNQSKQSSDAQSSSSRSSTDIPPHRRPPPSRSALDDKQRMREIKVDEEFEKLKKELGL